MCNVFFFTVSFRRCFQKKDDSHTAGKCKRQKRSKGCKRRKGNKGIVKENNFFWEEARSSILSLSHNSNFPLTTEQIAFENIHSWADGSLRHPQRGALKYPTPALLEVKTVM